jgi:hypothetical protein
VRKAADSSIAIAALLAERTYRALNVPYQLLP